MILFSVKMNRKKYGGFLWNFIFFKMLIVNRLLVILIIKRIGDNIIYRYLEIFVIKFMYGLEFIWLFFNFVKFVDEFEIGGYVVEMLVLVIFLKKDILLVFLFLLVILFLRRLYYLY